MSAHARRVGRIFAWFVVVVVAIAILSSIAVAANGRLPHQPTDLRAVLRYRPQYPIIVIVRLAAYGVIGLALVLATSMNAENVRARATSVDGRSRPTASFSIIATDCAAIVAGALLIAVVELVQIGVLLGWDVTFTYTYARSEWAMGAMALGATVFWYAIVQALTAWSVRPRVNVAIIVAVVLTFAVPFLHALVDDSWVAWSAMFYFDPFTYLSYAPYGEVRTLSFGPAIDASVILQVVAVWTAASCSLVIAAFGRRRAANASPHRASVETAL